MWVTRRSPSTRTRPRVMVVLPAAESPTTPSMMGRLTGIAGLLFAEPGGSCGDGHVLVELVGEDGAAQDVLRFDCDQVVARERAVETEEPAGLAQPLPVDRI